MVYTVIKSEQMFGFSQKVGIGWLASLGIYDIIRERKARKKIASQGDMLVFGLGKRKGWDKRKQKKKNNK